MRMTLEEQEQTQVEQDQVLEAKLEEAEKLATGKIILFKYLKTYAFIFFISLDFFPFKVLIVFIIIHNKNVFGVSLECFVTCHFPVL